MSGRFGLNAVRPAGRPLTKMIVLFSTLLLLLLSLTGETAMPPRKRPGAAGSNGGPRAKKSKTAGVTMKVLGKGLSNVESDSNTDPELSDTDEDAADSSLADPKTGIPAETLAFFSSSLDSSQILYDDYVQLVQPGKVLLTRHIMMMMVFYLLMPSLPLAILYRIATDSWLKLLFAVQKTKHLQTFRISLLARIIFNFYSVSFDIIVGSSEAGSSAGARMETLLS